MQQSKQKKKRKKMQTTPNNSNGKKNIKVVEKRAKTRRQTDGTRGRARDEVQTIMGGQNRQARIERVLNSCHVMA